MGLRYRSSGVVGLVRSRLRHGSTVGILGQHDCGGSKRFFEKIKNDVEDAPKLLWEKQVHACVSLLCGKGMLTLDEMRRGIEGLPEPAYTNWSYYGKWAGAMLKCSLERGTITQEHVKMFINPESDLRKVAMEHRYQPGDKVRVKDEDFLTRWQRPHVS